MTESSHSFDLIGEFCSQYFEDRQKESPYAMWAYVKNIPKGMRDLARRPDDDDDESSCCWKPIPGTVSEKDLRQLTSFFVHPLPLSYRYFLQQWHFIDMYLNQNDVRFFPNLPHQLTRKFREIIDKFYGGLPQRGLLPIANFGDWGVVCFDARKPIPDSDYPVVVLDHGDGYTNPMNYATTFREMFERERDGWVWVGVSAWKLKIEYRSG
jgi:hypothetical protein